MEPIKYHGRRAAALLVSLAAFAAVSCSEPAGETDTGEAVFPVEELIAPSNGDIINLGLSDDGKVTFRWKASATKGNPAVTYELLFITESGNFKKPLATIPSDRDGSAAEATVSYADLDAIFASGGVKDGARGTLVWSVATLHGTSREYANEKRKITAIRRDNSIPVPEQLFMFGSATEFGAEIGNAARMRPIARGRFEIFTKLLAFEPFYLVDATSGAEKVSYYINDGEIRLGEQASKVQREGAYRIVLDMEAKTAEIGEIGSFSLYFSTLASDYIDMEYKGAGVWSGSGYVAFANEPWGEDERYKFRMKAGGNDLFWGAKSLSDHRPTPNEDEAYFHMKEVAADQWSGVWKFATELDRQNVTVTVRLCGDDYTHTLEGRPVDNSRWEEIADQSSRSFADDFWNRSGFFNDSPGVAPGNLDYWPQAHAADLLLDAWLRTGDDIYKNKLTAWYDGLKIVNNGRDDFWNHFFDDMAWHGLAHFRIFEAMGDGDFENSSRDLWGWLRDGWREDTGGIPWNNDPIAPGTGPCSCVPSNAPSAILAVRRWNRYGDSEIDAKYGENDLQWAVKIYEFMRKYGYEEETGRVFEIYEDPKGDWTYNHGTFMGAAMELYDATGERHYFDDAVKVADRGMNYLIRGNVGVLSDWAEQTNHDVNLFKAIFIRYFTRLIMHPDLPADKRSEYIAFMVHNAHYLWDHGCVRSPRVRYNSAWYAKPDPDQVYLRGQVSGATLIEAMALLSRKGYLD